MQSFLALIVVATGWTLISYRIFSNSSRSLFIHAQRFPRKMNIFYDANNSRTWFLITRAHHELISKVGLQMDVRSLHRLNNRLKSQVEVITVMWAEEQTATCWSS